MISRVDEPQQLYAQGGVASLRQPYGFGSFVKKAFKAPIKAVKKVAKSPIGKAALLGAGLYGLNKWGPLTGKLTGGGNWLSKLGGGAWDWAKANPGKAGLLGLGAAGMALPFMASEEEEIIEEPWETTPSSIANIRDMARNRDASLAFMPRNEYVQAGYYLADGGRVGIANGGEVAEAQAENMLKMEYQKYRNQGGTMSYQQFKMAVLKQAQGQGPMAQTQPQMMNKGGRSGYALGEMVEGQDSEGVRMASDPGMGEGPFMLEEFLQAVKDGYKGTYEDFINDIDRSPADYLAQGGRVGLLGGGSVPGTRVAGYTTPAGYNKFDYPGGGVRVGAANGGIMPLLDLGGKEKDYRNEGGFVGIGRKEKADDVPARLSKNEFVFTADAVRNAGGGDIDAGAEVMENMMNHLEAGGEISEESQGIGAQGMYDNMRELETRIA